MGFLDKLYELFGKKKSKQLNLPEEIQITQAKEDTYVPLDLPADELVPFVGEILNTGSRENEEIFKHNLEILKKRAKESGKIEKFMLIREDDFFPYDWEWRVLSSQTNLEKVNTRFSFELRKAYALKKNGISPVIDINGIQIPNMGFDMHEVLATVDRDVVQILLPSRFRSTKHFTVNTPLGVTGNYNSVQTDRNFIIMDDINNFLESGYAYSVAYHDAYLDVSHEPLPISENALVLINKDKYEKLVADQKIAEQLAKRQVIVFEGDESIAVDMVLAQQGILPSMVGWKYTTYDQEIEGILDSGIRDLAKSNGLAFDKSHGGELKPEGGGHFSNYYDEQNRDYQASVDDFFEYIRVKFHGNDDLIIKGRSPDEEESRELIKRIGLDELLETVEEFNESRKHNIQTSIDFYKEERHKITPEIHKIFTETIQLINEFYKHEQSYESYDDRMKTEEIIRTFIQSSSVTEQVDAARKVWEVLKDKIALQEVNSQANPTVETTIGETNGKNTDTVEVALKSDSKTEITFDD